MKERISFRISCYGIRVLGSCASEIFLFFFFQPSLSSFYLLFFPAFIVNLLLPFIAIFFLFFLLCWPLQLVFLYYVMSKIAETINHPQSDKGETRIHLTTSELQNIYHTSQQPCRENPLSYFNQAEMEKFRSIFGSLEQSNGFCSQHSIVSPFLMDYMLHTDLHKTLRYHMMPFPIHFTAYSPCPSNRKIIVADGIVTTIVGVIFS